MPGMHRPRVAEAFGDADQATVAILERVPAVLILVTVMVDVPFREKNLILQGL